MNGPWWADGAWRFVSSRLKSNSVVFEWGSGSSTQCLASICKVISIENDKEWYAKLKGQMPHNVELKFIPDSGSSNSEPEDINGYSSNSALFNRRDFTDYVKSIDKFQNRFDLVIVDGRSRTSCLAHAIPKIKDGGMLLLDDPWREHYKPGINLIPQNWIRHNFKSPEHSTSVWIKP